MNNRRPSVKSIAALLAARGKAIVAAAIPRGDWLEFDTKLPGYDVGQLLLVFQDTSSLLLSSDLVRYGPDPWDETFVLWADLNEPKAEPLGLQNPGALEGFEVASPLNAVFAGNDLTQPELFVLLADAYPSNAKDYLPADSLRLAVGQHQVVLSTEGQGVLPLHLVLRSVSFPAFNTPSTGKRNWLYMQRVQLERPSTGGAGDA